MDSFNTDFRLIPRYVAWSSSLPKTQTLSLSYLFLLVGFVGLCLAVYPSCRVYSIIGAILIFMFAIAFVRRIRTLAVAGAFAFALIWIATIVDVLFHGPATQHHNQRLAEIAYSNQLIGKPKETAIALLGTPTSTFDTRNGETLNYAPFRCFPHGIVQVHCKDRVVSSIELYDD